MKGQNLEFSGSNQTKNVMISIWFFKNVNWNFDNLIFYSMLRPSRLKIEDFCHFERLSATFAGHIRQKIKIKKIAAKLFKKSLSRVIIPKIRTLSQILRPLNFFPGW